MSQPRKGKACRASARRKAGKRKRVEARNRRDRAYRRAKANVKTTRRSYRTGKRGKSERRVQRKGR